MQCVGPLSADASFFVDPVSCVFSHRKLFRKVKHTSGISQSCGVLLSSGGAFWSLSCFPLAILCTATLICVPLFVCFSITPLEINKDGEVRDRRREEPEAEAEEARPTGHRSRRHRGNKARKEHNIRSIYTECICRAPYRRKLLQRDNETAELRCVSATRHFWPLIVPRTFVFVEILCVSACKKCCHQLAAPFS